MKTTVYVTLHVRVTSHERRGVSHNPQLDFTVHEYDGLLPDVHCPISFTLQLDYENKDRPGEVKKIANKSSNLFTDRPDITFEWNVDGNDVFKDSITHENIDILFQKIIDFEESPSQFAMNKFCKDLNDFTIKKAKDCNICKAHSETNSVKRNKKNAKIKLWFDAECMRIRNY